MPGNPLTPTHPGAGRCGWGNELRTALDTICAAAANLRHYRDRLTPEDHAAAVNDIEQAAEQIAARLAMQPRSASAPAKNGERGRR